MTTKAYLPPDCYPDGSEQQKRAIEWAEARGKPFIECASCAAKPGTPTLCVSRLTRRAASTWKPPRAPRHKFGAVRTEVKGRSYPSKLEASYAAELYRRKEAGEIVGWLEQCPLRLAGGVTYLLDFLVFEADGTVRAVECKGFATPVWKVKEKLVAEAYPWLPIEVVTKPPRTKAPRAAKGKRP